VAVLDFTAAFHDRGAARGIADLARQFGKASDTAASLEGATKRLEAAERKVADAAGAARVAESRLQQVRNNGKASAAQRIAAEENLAKAQRRLSGAQAEVKASSQQLVTAQKKVRASVQETTQTTEQSSGKMRTLGAATSRFSGMAGIALAAAGTAAVGFGLKVASGNEQARISFTTMLGSAQKADVFLRQLQKFAATTPFEFPELQTAASSLISAGVNANKVIPIMRTLGDVTAGMGTGAQGVQRATVALQQMNAAGRITAEDLNQLRDAGIPVYDLLAAATKKSKTEVAALAQAGKLGRRELEQLMAALESGKGLEKFNGLMQEQSKSLAGMISTLRDDLGQGLAGALQGLFPIIKASIGAWNDLGSGTKATLGVIAGSTVAFGIATSGAVKLAGGFRTLGLSASAARVAVGGVGAALGVATFAFGLYATSHAKAEARVADFTQALEGETNALNQNVRVVAAKQLQDRGALAAAQSLGLSLDVVTNAALGQEGALRLLQPMLDGYVAAGVNGSIADQDRASAAAKVSDAIRGVGGSYNKAVIESKEMNAATGGVAGSLGGAEKKAKSAKEALAQWRQEMFRSSRAALELAGTEDAFEQSIDEATRAVKDNGRNLDSNTEKGRNNRAALRNLASSSLSYRETLIKQGAKQKDVTEATERGRKKFIETAIKMGATKKEANKLADEFGFLDRKINGLNNKKVTISFGTGSYSIGGVKYKVNLTSPSSVGRSAAGGLIKGRGGGTSDSIMGVDLNGWPTTRVSNGEFVVNAKSTAKHRAHLEAINKDGLAGGGLVSAEVGDMPRGAATAPSTANRFGNVIAKAMGKELGRVVGSRLELPSTGGVGGNGGLGPQGKGMAAAIRAGRRLGADSIGTYPGHHPSMAKARDFMISSRGEGNNIAAHMKSNARQYGIWYVIWNRRIASRTYPGMPWRRYTRSNPHTDHVHVSWYDRGGMLRPGGMAANASGKPERVLSPAQTQAFDRLVKVIDRRGSGTVATSTRPINILIDLGDGVAQRVQGVIDQNDEFYASVGRMHR
jgi:tape measure domain-containing protein